MRDEKLLSEMGERLAQKRKSLSLSQEELAAMADVSAQMISTAERGEKALRPENLLKISRALGTSTDYLLTGEILPPNTATLEQKLRLIPPQYLPLVECVVDACIKLK
ncbi:MAG: helix-turn-helix domain-containing protein [Ruminococcus bromii]|nr:helix-turn-helix domain-containing protein [Ruminococcus bromii]